MILWLKTDQFPIDIQSGDILFISGCIPRDQSISLPFEHVALATESKSLNNEADLLNLRVHGMPESRREAKIHSNPGISQTTGHYYLCFPYIGRLIGSSDTAWNLIGRSHFINAEKSMEIAYTLSLLEGSLDWTYAHSFKVDSTLQGTFRTNCLGFVCSVLPP